MQRGFTLRGLLITCFILGSLIPIVIPIFLGVNEESRQVKCKANLDQMGKIMKVYVLDYGRNVLFPQSNGAGFLTTLYNDGLLTEPKVFLCPSTPDDNQNGKALQNITGADPDRINAVSYAGRNNAKQQIYPGIFRPGCDTSYTSMAADDIQQEDNHIDVHIFLFIDGHSDHFRPTKPRKNGLSEDMKKWYDPLGN